MRHIKVKLDELSNTLIVETDYKNADVDHSDIQRSVLGNMMRHYGIHELETCVSECDYGCLAIRRAFDEKFKETHSTGFFETFNFL
jgi:hypothetical protein